MQCRRVAEWADVELRRELWSSWELTAAGRELIASGELHYYKELRAHIYMLQGSCERKWRATLLQGRHERKWRATLLQGRSERKWSYIRQDRGERKW